MHRHMYIFHLHPHSYQRTRPHLHAHQHSHPCCCKLRMIQIGGPQIKEQLASGFSLFSSRFFVHGKNTHSQHDTSRNPACPLQNCSWNTSCSLKNFSHGTNHMELRVARSAQTHPQNTACDDAFANHTRHPSSVRSTCCQRRNLRSAPAIVSHLD